MENLLALGVLVLIVAVVAGGLWALARHGEKSRQAIEEEQKRPPEQPQDVEEGEAQGPEEPIPALEALLLGLELPSLEALTTGDRKPAPRQARAYPLGSATSPLPLLTKGLGELGLSLPASLVGEDRFLFLPAAEVAAAGKVLAQAFERSEELAKHLERLEREGAASGATPPDLALIEQALRGGTEMVRLTPAVDAARLMRLLHERCIATRPSGESVLLVVRSAGCKEAARAFLDEPAPAAPDAPRLCFAELQVLRARFPGPDGAAPPRPRLRAALRAPAASTFFPSGQRVLFLLVAALQKAGFLFPLGESEDMADSLFVIASDDVDGALNTLEAACGDKRDPLLKSDKRDELVQALVDLEREAGGEDGPRSDPAALRKALDADRVPPGASPAVEAAVAVRVLMGVARDAKRQGDDLALLHRRCDLSPS